MYAGDKKQEEQSQSRRADMGKGSQAKGRSKQQTKVGKPPNKPKGTEVPETSNGGGGGRKCAKSSGRGKGPEGRAAGRNSEWGQNKPAKRGGQAEPRGEQALRHRAKQNRNGERVSRRL